MIFFSKLYSQIKFVSFVPMRSLYMLLNSSLTISIQPTSFPTSQFQPNGEKQTRKRRGILRPVCAPLPQINTAPV